MVDVPKGKRTPEEILDAIEESDADDEAERILALSDEQLDRELAQAGFDPQAVRRRGSELARQRPEAPKVASRRINPRWLGLLAAALGAVAIVVMLVVPRPPPDTHPPPPLDAATPSSSSQQIAPELLRARALAACREHRWRECLEGLDAAKALDPAGDADRAVQVARKEALSAIGRDSEK